MDITATNREIVYNTTTARQTGLILVGARACMQHGASAAVEASGSRSLARRAQLMR